MQLHRPTLNDPSHLAQVATASAASEVQNSANIANLLLVSGPSASGKSAFIKALLSGDLPPELVSLLPEGECWDYYTEAKYAARDSFPQGAIVLLHYDTTRPIRLGFCTFERDEALMNLLPRAARVTVVTITLDNRRLLRQYVTRENAFKRFLMATGLDRIRGRGDRLPLIHFYKKTEWVAALDQSWKEFLSGLPGVICVTISPDLEPFKFLAEGENLSSV